MTPCNPPVARDNSLEVIDALELPRGWRGCQRWRDRRHAWADPRTGGFDPGGYQVAALDESLARGFVEANHYTGSYPAARLRYGMWERATGSLVGVGVLSVPVRAEVLTGVFPDLVAYHEALELGRFVLLDHVPANAETWLLARLFRLAASAGVRGVVSFSDVMDRVSWRRWSAMVGG